MGKKDKRERKEEGDKERCSLSSPDTHQALAVSPLGLLLEGLDMMLSWTKSLRLGDTCRFLARARSGSLFWPAWLPALLPSRPGEILVPHLLGASM